MSRESDASMTQSEMIEELHRGQNSQLHHSSELMLDDVEGLESLRRDEMSYRLPDSYRGGDIEEGGGGDEESLATPRTAKRRMYRTMKQLSVVGRRGSQNSPAKPKPVLHPKVKKFAENFFDKVRSADPVERINSVLSSTRREFKSSAHTVRAPPSNAARNSARLRAILSRLRATLRTPTQRCAILRRRAPRAPHR